jgi:hypothetical protein
MAVPDDIKIYHIVHISKLRAIVQERFLVSDAEIQKRETIGVTIGMREIKRRRLEKLTLSSHPGLHIGDCVPFYFCPRSVMLYMFHMANNPDVEYRGGQEPILHLVAGLLKTVEWANANSINWAFTTSNAGSNYFEDYANLSALDKVDWEAVQAMQWSGRQDKKQAEFLVRRQFPWELIEEVGVYSHMQLSAVSEILAAEMNPPSIKVKPSWYY